MTYSGTILWLRIKDFIYAPELQEAFISVKTYKVGKKKKKKRKILLLFRDLSRVFYVFLLILEIFFTSLRRPVKIIYDIDYKQPKYPWECPTPYFIPQSPEVKPFFPNAFKKGSNIGPNRVVGTIIQCKPMLYLFDQYFQWVKILWVP